MKYLVDIWNWKIQLIPIFLSIVLFELPAIIRRIKKIYYVPIYFSVFPLNQLNQDLSLYLIEGDIYALGVDQTKSQAERLRKKIIIISVLSMAISALFTPLIAGFFIAFYMNGETFTQFIVILLIYKVIMLSKSIYQFHFYAVGSIRNRILLGIIYFCYLGVIFEVLRTTYFWIIPYIQSKEWVRLLSDLSALVFGKFIIGILLLSLFTAVFSSLITDREIRERELSKYR